MTRMKFTVLAIVAVCSVSGVAAGNALATEIVNGKGEALVKNKFTDTFSKTTIETVGGTKVGCEGATGQGTVTSKVAGEETLTFTGCAVGTTKCNTEGSKAGEISIKIRFTLLSGGLLSMEISISFSFSCGASVFKAKGSFLSPIGSAQEHIL